MTIQEVIATFPKQFSLRAFPGKVFRCADWPASFMENNQAHVVVEVEREGRWLQFGRDTPQALRKELVA